MKVRKSLGQTRTEKLLGYLCDNTFLKLWSYLNPYQEDGKELCDLLVVFENHIFIFFDRENLKLTSQDANISLNWARWKKEVIDKQIKTALGAEKYIKSQKGIYLDGKCTKPFPLKLPANELQIHKIIVAHGARELCKNFSKDNVAGSLAITYGLPTADLNVPFMVQLDKDDCVHVLDSENLEIILRELDTFCDFKLYLQAKEEAIRNFDLVCYCGEEDLLAHYFYNFDEVTNSHYIGTKEEKVNAVYIGEGEWLDFIQSPIYKRKKEADKSSYLWDTLIQKTSDNALNGSLLGDGNVFHDRSAIIEMAKEPRFSRRALSDHMMKAIDNFPADSRPLVRNLSFMSSFYYKETAYVFLQLKYTSTEDYDYDKDYRPKRQAMLEIACGAAKNKFPHLKKVIGIAIDSPKFSEMNSEDFIFLDCSEWSEKEIQFYEEKNRGLKFFETTSLKREVKNVSEFPVESEPPLRYEDKPMGRTRV